MTHDRTYKKAEHTDDCGDTFLFDVIDAGGLVFEDSMDAWWRMSREPSVGGGRPRVFFSLKGGEGQFEMAT